MEFLVTFQGGPKMTNWYRDIFPCISCENGPHIGKECKKGHDTTFVEGCSKCGTLVNLKWYYKKEECPDFVYYEPHDPSGS